MSKHKHYGARVPLYVKGGIRAQGVQGGGRSWWSKRWTEMMQDFRIGARLGRGRSYAVSGQVSELDIMPGQIEADVQGASRDPYHCVLKFKQVSPEILKRIRVHLDTHPILIAQLMAGEMPPGIEELFKAEGMPFFPQRKGDVWSHCTCPDYANPCKHLAAVYFLLGEAFARNPGLLLTLRGVSLPLLDLPEKREPEPLPPVPAEAATPSECYGIPAEGGFAPEEGGVDGRDAPLLFRLGPVPFWRGQERFSETLRHIYLTAAGRGRIAWTGDFLDLRRENEKVAITGGNLQLKGKRLKVDSFQ